jgi:hypothetical protein
VRVLRKEEVEEALRPRRRRYSMRKEEVEEVPEGGVCGTGTLLGARVCASPCSG